MTQTIVALTRDVDGANERFRLLREPHAKPMVNLNTMPKAFVDAVAEIERELDVKGRQGEFCDEDLEGVMFFDVASDDDSVMGKGREFVAMHRARLLSTGVFLFLRELGSGHGEPDIVAIAPTTDKFDVVRRAQTDAANYDRDNDELVAWLRELDGEEPFELTGAGVDFIEGYFREPVVDRSRLAKRIYAFCPDFVHQGIGMGSDEDPHELIERLFATERYFFFWWD